MGDVIDALVVTLGLDDKQYREGMKRYREDRKTLGDEDAKQNRVRQDGQKKTIEGLRTLRNETAGFLLMLAGANSVKDFTTNLLANEAATGRIAENLGLATKRVMAWQQAMRDVGGDPKSANSALGILSSIYNKERLGINTGTGGDLRGLGVLPSDMTNPETALLKIAAAASRLSKPEFQERTRRLGFDADTIYLMEKYGASLNKVIDAKERDIRVTDDDVKKAQELQKTFGDITSKIENALLPTINRLAEAFLDWITKGNNLNNLLIVTGTLMGGIALAVGAATWPFFVLAGAIAVVVANLENLQKAWDELPDIFTPKSGTPPPARDPGGQSVGGWFGEILGLHAGEGKPGATGNKPSGGSGAAASGPGNRNAGYVERYFRSRGYTAAQARGIAAAVVAEGGLTQPRGGGYKGRALGIGQLLGPRRAEFLRRYGNNFTFANELEFMHYELQGGDPGGAKVRAQTTERGVLRSMIDDFYRPAKGRETIGDWNRGLAHLAGGVGGAARASAEAASSGANWKLRGAGTVTQTTTIGQVSVYTAATDAEGIARDMRGALAKRGLVVQANTGLQP